jgi:hypothetical protein
MPLTGHFQLVNPCHVPKKPLSAKNALLIGKCNVRILYKKERFLTYRLDPMMPYSLPLLPYFAETKLAK